MIASGDGHVINISACSGCSRRPGQATYSAAKFAVRGTTVHPGGIKTNIVRNMTAVESVDKDQLAKKFDRKLANTSPLKAAQTILGGVRRNRARALVGPDARALDLIVRVTGSAYQRLFSTAMSRMVPEAH